jgi:hypothetical protein
MLNKLRKSNLVILPLSALSLMFLLGAGPEGGCGQGLDNRPGEPGIDVGGVSGASWSVSYQDTVEVIVKNAGGVISTQNISLAAGGTFDVGGIKVNLTELCARPDVACPNEIFPHQVKMTQPGKDLHLLYVNFNKVGPLENLEQTTLLGNVDSDFDFSIALGIQGAAVGTCGLLAVSYATGHIDHDAAAAGEAPKGTSLDGDIVTAYHGGCIIPTSSGTVAGGITVELRVPFKGQRL